MTHLQHTPDAFNEEPPAVLPAVLHAKTLNLVPHSRDDFLHLVVLEQVRDLARGQQIIDQH